MSILTRFLKKSQSPTYQVLNGKAHLISGLFYWTEKGYFYIKGGKRYKVFSQRCFDSWNSDAIETAFINISHIPYGGVLGFRDGTIIHNLADGKIYIVSDGKRMHIKTPDAFPEGWIEDMKMVVSEAEANLHKDGQDINAS
jgi:hypothetical protein